MKKLIYTSLLVLALSACSPPNTATDVGQSPVKTTPTSQARSEVKVNDSLPAKGIVATLDKVKHEVFASVGACTNAGFAQLQCDRARDTALAMFVLSPPLYETKNACEDVFVKCNAWSSGDNQGKYSPITRGFSMGGEQRGSEGPSEKSPSMYAPVFINKDGQAVLAFTNAEKTITKVLLDENEGSSSSFPKVN